MLDFIEAVADRIVIFDVCVAPVAASELAALLVDTTKKVALAPRVSPPNKKKAPEMLALCDDVVPRLETAAATRFLHRGAPSDRSSCPATTRSW